MNGRGRRFDPDLPRYERYRNGIPLRPHSRGPTAVLWERLRHASTAHTFQGKNLGLPRQLPAAAQAVPGRVGPVVVGDRPPLGDLSPHRMALG